MAFVEYAGPAAERSEPLQQTRGLTYNDLSADRNVVAALEVLEAVLQRRAAGRPGCVAEVNAAAGGLVLRAPGGAEPEVLCAEQV